MTMHCFTPSIRPTMERGFMAKRSGPPVTGSFQELKATAEMLIYKGIDIIPQLVILPYDPNNLNM
jgi:hypothetical protein